MVLGILRKLYLSDRAEIWHVGAELCEMLYEKKIFNFRPFYVTPHDLG